MQLCAAIVVFAASLPHAKVRNPVGPLHTEHQVLDEGNLSEGEARVTALKELTLHTEKDFIFSSINSRAGMYGNKWPVVSICGEASDSILHRSKKMKTADFSSALKVRVSLQLQALIKQWICEPTQSLVTLLQLKYFLVITSAFGVFFYSFTKL